MNEKEWKTIEKNGEPKETGWYVISLHEGRWEDEEGDSKIVIDAQDILAIAHYKLVKDGFSWTHILELNHEDDLLEIEYTECAFEFINASDSSGKDDDHKFDVRITAWQKIPEVFAEK